MTLALNNLIAEARALANDHPCTTVGHDWQSEGGRRCPHAAEDDDGCGNSQAVYRCARCGGYDYGEPGGPGHADCSDNWTCSRSSPRQVFLPSTGDTSMKVRVWVEQEVEAEVSTEAALAELANMPQPARDFELKQLLNRCVGALRNCPDELVSALPTNVRQIVADALRQQALRYDPGLELVRSGLAGVPSGGEDGAIG